MESKNPKLFPVQDWNSSDSRSALGIQKIRSPGADPCSIILGVGENSGSERGCFFRGRGEEGSHWGTDTPELHSMLGRRYIEN